MDVSADQPGLGGVGGVVCAGEREVPQRSELRLDPVQPGGVVRGVGQLDGVLGGPPAHPICRGGAEVVKDEVQPDLGWVQRPDVTAELQELRSARVLAES